MAVESRHFLPPLPLGPQFARSSALCSMLNAPLRGPGAASVSFASAIQFWEVHTVAKRSANDYCLLCGVKSCLSQVNLISSNDKEPPKPNGRNTFRCGAESGADFQNLQED